jgi:hypothetical protein
MTTTLVIRHRIGDFDTWLEVYRGFADIQREGGVRAHMALRAEEDPADILVTHTFATREEAEAYLQDERLAAAMADATVDDASVSIEFYEEVAAGP